MSPNDNAFFERVYWVVRHIPPGRVATYGQIARLLGVPRGARTVGWALRSLPDDREVPWQRVINAQGRISTGWDEPDSTSQRALLEAEGVAFHEQGRVDLKVYGWAGLDLAEWQQLHEAEAGIPHLPA